jgi:hypothetical protein
MRLRHTPSLLLIAVHLLAALPAQAQPSPSASPTSPSASPTSPSASTETKRNEARVLFESGIAHFDRGEWSAALADFLRSREILPTRSATKNAAVCLRREGRFDEALEMYEALLREFADLSAADRTFAEKEIEQLRALVGSLEIAGAEPGASIVVDGRARGTYPPPAPLRVPAGSHVVRVYKEGFAPFERRVDVASRQTVLVEAKLQALTQAGRLSVTESSGAALDVVVDNVVVGKSPWEGTVAAGAHTVVLRGEDDLGTQPATTSVKVSQLTTLALAAEPLTSSLRVMPVPAGGTVSIDAVVVGQGVWEGKLREGAHRVEVAAEGFLPARQDVRLAKKERSAITVTLDRDLSSPLWRRASRVFLGADAGMVLGLRYGGDVRDACSGACSADVPLGLAITARGGYEFASGVTLGLDVGYLVVAAGVSARPAEVLPRGLAPNRGAADETLGLRGVRFGPSAGFRFGDDLPITIRFGAGAFIGSAVDARRGRFTTSGGTPYEVDLSESVAAAYIYLAPEARIAKRLGRSGFASHVEVGAGVAVLALVALDQPTWSNEQTVLAAPAGQQGDGVGTFAKESLAGSFILGVVPSLDARYAF